MLFEWHDDLGLVGEMAGLFGRYWLEIDAAINSGIPVFEGGDRLVPILKVAMVKVDINL